MRGEEQKNNNSEKKTIIFLGKIVKKNTKLKKMVLIGIPGVFILNNIYEIKSYFYSCFYTLRKMFKYEFL